MTMRKKLGSSLLAGALVGAALFASGRAVDLPSVRERGRWGCVLL